MIRECIRLLYADLFVRSKLNNSVLNLAKTLFVGFELILGYEILFEIHPGAKTADDDPTVHPLNNRIVKQSAVFALRSIHRLGRDDDRRGCGRRRIRSLDLNATRAIGLDLDDESLDRLPGRDTSNENSKGHNLRLSQGSGEDGVGRSGDDDVTHICCLGFGFSLDYQVERGTRVQVSVAVQM